MTIPLTGNGSLFQRLGNIWGGVADLLALEGGTATARVLSGASWQTRLTTLDTQYADSPANVSLISGDNGFGQSTTPLSQIVNNWMTSSTSFFTNLQTLAQNTLIKMADQDASGLPQRTLSAALTYLINQMTANSSTVNATTIAIGSQTNSGTPNGNPIIVVSGLNGKGQTLQYPYSEQFTFTVSQDAQSGGATLGQESLSVQGQVAVTNTWSYSWPGGSGTNLVLNATDSQVNNSGANINVLQNGSFDTFTNVGAADNWVVSVGTPNTQTISGGSANAYKGGNSIGFVGDASTLTAITQQFNTTPSTTLGAGGTSYKVLPATPYAVNGWVKMSSASPLAGVLEIALTDGSGTIQNDASGTACSTTVALTTIADTNWHNFNAVFRLPLVLPTQVKLRIRLSTALSSGKTVYIDSVSMNPMTPLYSGGPYVSIFSGNTAMVLNDAWTVSFTPTYGQVQLYSWRFFNLPALGMRLPSATVSPTVPDSVIA